MIFVSSHHVGPHQLILTCYEGCHGRLRAQEILFVRKKVPRMT
jgi:hypothetical protein